MPLQPALWMEKKVTEQRRKRASLPVPELPLGQPPPPHGDCNLYGYGEPSAPNIQGNVTLSRYNRRISPNFGSTMISITIRVDIRAHREEGFPLQERCPPRQISRVERLKAKVEPLLTSSKSGDLRCESQSSRLARSSPLMATATCCVG
jgi:hypothetical protein